MFKTLQQSVVFLQDKEIGSFICIVTTHNTSNSEVPKDLVSFENLHPQKLTNPQLHIHVCAQTLLLLNTAKGYTSPK